LKLLVLDRCVISLRLKCNFIVIKEELVIFYRFLYVIHSEKRMERYFYVS
jgi:hypothetical protein